MGMVSENGLATRAPLLLLLPPRMLHMQPPFVSFDHIVVAGSRLQAQVTLLCALRLQVPHVLLPLVLW
jgi:hypothetical protein